MKKILEFTFDGDDLNKILADHLAYKINDGKTYKTIDTLFNISYDRKKIECIVKLEEIT